MTALAQGKCAPGMPLLAAAEIAAHLTQLPGWAISDGKLSKTYRFKHYHETMAFVNASAWISHREDHHPDLEVGYNQCTVRYFTHDVGGLTNNDFICAAKIDALFEL
jgi:4a-hydroxytetrahydrobiopterin dehydratase